MATRGATTLVFICATLFGAALAQHHVWLTDYLTICKIASASSLLLWSMLVFTSRPSGRLLQPLLVVNLITFGLELGVALAGPSRWADEGKNSLGIAGPLMLSGLLALSLLYLYWRWGSTTKPSPEFGPPSDKFGLLVGQTLALTACSLPIFLMPMGIAVIQKPELATIGLATLLTHQLCALGLIINCCLISAEEFRFSFQNFGFSFREKPVQSAFLVLSTVGAYQYSHQPLWILLALLFIRARYVKSPLPPAQLTPAQATLLLRLPLNVTNQCLRFIPPNLWPSWFRADRQRLHLLEPLLEVQNAPRYFKSLAKLLVQTYNLSPEQLATQEQLADFCLAHPVTVSTVLLSTADYPEADELSDWKSTDLNQVRPANKITMLQNLVWLSKISKRLGGAKP